MTSTAPARGLFVTGTDTNVGKTHIAALIVRAMRSSGQRVGACKPVCSGAVLDSAGVIHWDDIDQLRGALGVDYLDDAICPQRFLAPLAPPHAARAEGRTVDFARLVSGIQWWGEQADVLIVEGVGGLLAPVTEKETAADLARAIGYPMIIVARCGLGTINHTLLTIEAARQRGLSMAGVILNQSHPADEFELAEANAIEIELRGGVPVLGTVACGSSDGLHRHGCLVTIDWSDLAAR